jgi:hypothetical protein
MAVSGASALTGEAPMEIELKWSKRKQFWGWRKTTKETKRETPSKPRPALMDTEPKSPEKREGEDAPSSKKRPKALAKAKALALADQEELIEEGGTGQIPRNKSQAPHRNKKIIEQQLKEEKQTRRNRSRTPIRHGFSASRYVKI